MNDVFTRYFTDAGFEVLGMEGMDTSPSEADGISNETIYQHLKASFNKHPTAQGIYLLGSGAWGVKDIIAAENDIGVPVVHPVAARVWYVQKLLKIKNPLKGASRLLEELPISRIELSLHSAQSSYRLALIQLAPWRILAGPVSPGCP